VIVVAMNAEKIWKRGKIRAGVVAFTAPTNTKLNHAPYHQRVVD
jgi:hypothetical protein